MIMSKQKQIILIITLSFSLGILRSFFINDQDFFIIKKERVLEQINTFSIPNDITGPMVVSLEFAKYHHDKSSVIFIDARDPEDYDKGHIQGAINIPYDYYEDYDGIIDELDDSAIYITYCNGEECSLSIDLADYLYNDKLFDTILIFEGGWPEWKKSGYP